MPLAIKNLPPLNALVAFDAAATSLSFTQAAAKLFVTQGAVSRQIRLLEDNLGVTLFDRTQRQICLTHAGRDYHQQISGALAQISLATQALQNPVVDTQITIAASHAVASLWLMPRISDYSRVYPDVDIRLLVADSVFEADVTDYDCSIGFSHSEPTGVRVEKLFNERVFVVSSPDFLAQHQGLTPAQLLATRQLVLDNPMTGWFNWREWFLGLDMAPVVPQHKVTFSHYNMLIQAAQQGQGVALAWDYLLDDYLATGSLVKAFDQTLETQAGFYLTTSENGSKKTVLAEFCSWLIDNS
ncbi:MAG: LysR family transcriptional regulator [Oceanospirillaceae bacterium]|jgi:DNA-binding transcriptional LysR family regulator|nr:LysR family transcriptional regulator [Oceanospirillaceae bacterium]MBT4443186.1 LysR family transcriptional regulator [Oceanospirillaceae bacterium]MBT6078076.1 LysR family transcriptional regulator [Oceanospirillaceae bacterium]